MEKMEQMDRREPLNPTVDVLIVEDDVKIAEINRRFVEKVAGFHVVGIATDSGQAEEQLEVLTPHLVLLDVYLPGANGLDMLSFIRQHYRETDVIMITAAKEMDAIREAIRGGAFDYIMKPLVFNRLQETLLRYLNFHRELRRMNESGMINQSDVDRLLLGSSKKEASSDTFFLPKGIDKLTLVKIVQAISVAESGLTAEQIAKEIGVSRSTGRRYLEHLVSSGDLYADLSYGVVGRPERVYRKNK
ncbi:response regulator [Paenibacillus sp. HWE-109]|uniref:response regulator n=1 Tax=Paenibacillus sp. HWE-109 TaxID=1306526 RepID=UPI001EDDBE8C|nr:response regulator [Paenibacillus sp. HWE-109]UKS30801.1 response regulator [Paenibacillus sp. HWE-109]